MVIKGLGRARLPGCTERAVDAAELLEQADGRVLSRQQLNVTDELLGLGPATGDPKKIPAGNAYWLRDTDLRAPETLPQALKSLYPSAADPGAVNAQDERRLSVYPHVEVELTAEVCPIGPSGDLGD